MKRIVSLLAFLSPDLDLHRHRRPREVQQGARPRRQGSRLGEPRRHRRQEALARRPEGQGRGRRRLHLQQLPGRGGLRTAHHRVRREVRRQAGREGRGRGDQREHRQGRCPPGDEGARREEEVQLRLPVRPVAGDRPQVRRDLHPRVLRARQGPQGGLHRRDGRPRAARRAEGGLPRPGG